MMLKLLFLSLFLSFPLSAQEHLNWQALEVTTDDDEDSRLASGVPASVEKADGRFKSLMDDLQSSVDFDKERKKKNRTVEAVNQETVYSAIVEMIETSFPGGVDAMLEKNELIEDEIYRLIQLLPEYAYQYIGPFINEMPYVPDRILNIPGIKATKGKFPTRIAPQMREYAKKYGKYMSTHLYLYLMPEAWATVEQEKSTFKGYSKIITIDENTKPDDLFEMTGDRKNLLKKYKLLSPEKYQTGEAFKKQVRPQTPADKVTETSSLTEGDVEAALASFSDIEKEFGTNRFDDFHSTLRDMSLSDNNLMEEMLNPMQMLVDKVNRLPEKDRFARTVAKTGFTPRSWALTVDKIIKARRVEKMSTAIAMNVGHWRRMKHPPKSFDVLSPRDRQISWDSIQLFVGMYTSTYENLLAVKNYGDNIRKTLVTRDMMYMEMPVYGIN